MFRRLMLTLFLLALIGCAEEETPVVEPEPPPNQPPIIDRLILPDKVEANTPLKLQVIARDADQDNLSIVWEVSEGTVDDDVWTTPDRATEVVISVHVSDHTNPTVTQTRNVIVNKELPPPPLVQPEPLPGEAVGAGEWNIIGRVGIEHVAPGQETLKVSIGDTTEEVNAIAQHIEWLREDSQILFHPRLGQFHCVYEDGKTIAITIADDLYKTAEGIRVGSHVDDVVAEYGNPDDINPGEQVTFHTYFRRGYIFGFDDTKRVVLILSADKGEMLCFADAIDCLYCDTD